MVPRKSFRRLPIQLRCIAFLCRQLPSVDLDTTGFRTCALRNLYIRPCFRAIRFGVNEVAAMSQGKAAIAHALTPERQNRCIIRKCAAAVGIIVASLRLNIVFLVDTRFLNFAIPRLLLIAHRNLAQISRCENDDHSTLSRQFSIPQSLCPQRNLQICNVASVALAAGILPRTSRMSAILLLACEKGSNA